MLYNITVGSLTLSKYKAFSNKEEKTRYCMDAVVMFTP